MTAPSHGLTLVAAFPLLPAPDHPIKEWAVVIDRGESLPRDRWVTGWSRSLDSRTWSHGHYHPSLESAVRDALDRASYGITIRS